MQQLPKGPSDLQSLGKLLGHASFRPKEPPTSLGVHFPACGLFCGAARADETQAKPTMILPRLYCIVAAEKKLLFCGMMISRGTFKYRQKQLAYKNIGGSNWLDQKKL